MQHLEGSGTPVLYIGRTVLKGLSEDLIVSACFLGGTRHIFIGVKGFSNKNCDKLNLTFHTHCISRVSPFVVERMSECLS
jgi:hypothetical protein